MPKNKKIILKKIVSVVSFTFILSSCTISFQNISTHGVANDLVDEEQGGPNVSPTISATVPCL